MSVSHYIFKPDAAVDIQAYKDIDGQKVVMVRQLDIEANETDQVEWEVVPIYPIPGKAGQRWYALPHELIPCGERPK